jgi:hypothetical protein
MMHWQAKLRLLAQAAVHNHPLTTDLFYIQPPLLSAQIAELTRDLPFQLPAALHDFYAITDGAYLADWYRICSLSTPALGGATLQTLNDESLADARGMYPMVSLQFLLGTTWLGEFLGLTDRGAVVTLPYAGGQAPTTIAESLDHFFADICLGAGYVQLHQPDADDGWLCILQEFSFLPNHIPSRTAPA